MGFISVQCMGLVARFDIGLIPIARILNIIGSRGGQNIDSNCEKTPLKSYEYINFDEVVNIMPHSDPDFMDSTPNHIEKLRSITLYLISCQGRL